MLAVRWYLRFGLSFRDVEELLAERGIEVDHVTVHRWVRRFAPLLPDAARFGRHRVGDRWHVDETHVKVAGRWVYLVPGGRPVRAGHRRVRLHSTGQRGGPSVLPTRQRHHRCDTVGGHRRPRADLSARPRSGRARGMAPRRAVREQPRRGRPRPAETSAVTDARNQDHDRTSGSRRGPRIRSEPAPRALRDRRRPARQASAGHRVSPTGHGNLTARLGETPAPHASRSTNATHPASPG
jgi:hypothetical protein